MNSINFDLDTCIGCGVGFDSKVSKTKHHIFPKFLNPKVNATIPLCKECHKKLNESYAKNADYTIPTTFIVFKQRYEELRDKFTKKTLDRGKFGEGLWQNLVSYLEELDGRIK